MSARGPAPGDPPAPLDGLRVVLAPNPGPFTLDGTRTYLVGSRTPAVIDPGPDLEEHLRRVASEVADADSVTLLLTHGHGDHAGGTDGLVGMLAAEGTDVRVRGAGHPAAGALPDGAIVETDAGVLEVVETPGHDDPHVAFLWRETRALFPGDLVLGEGDTTWVGAYPGCVADYLDSLARVRQLEPELLLPTHGAPVTEPARLLDRYEAHRRARIAEVRSVLEESPGAGPAEVLDRVYGDAVPAGLRDAALASVEALVHHVEAERRR